MKLTDEILDNFELLARSNNTWTYSFQIYKATTVFHIEKRKNIGYLIKIKQIEWIRGLFENEVTLGIVDEIEDLKNMFHSLTRGEELI